MYLNYEFKESSIFFTQYLHISFRVKLDVSFTYEHLMVGHFHNTFARTVNCMRSTTRERTLTTTVLYVGIGKIKIMPNIFSFWIDQSVNIPTVLE